MQFWKVTFGSLKYWNVSKAWFLFKAVDKILFIAFIVMAIDLEIIFNFIFLKTFYIVVSSKYTAFFFFFNFCWCIGL